MYSTTHGTPHELQVSEIEIYSEVEKEAIDVNQTASCITILYETESTY